MSNEYLSFPIPPIEKFAAALCSGKRIYLVCHEDKKSPFLTTVTINSLVKVDKYSPEGRKQYLIDGVAGNADPKKTTDNIPYCGRLYYEPHTQIDHAKIKFGKKLKVRSTM